MYKTYLSPRSLLFTIWLLVSLTANTGHAALKIMVDSRDSDLIVVDNDQYMEGATGYLVWLDLDEFTQSNGQKGVISWTPSGWEEGLHQVSDGPFVAPVVKGLSIARIPRPCPNGHRCFVGAALLGPDQSSPILSFYPLNSEAALERLPGQWKFASSTRASIGGLDQGLLTPTSTSSEEEGAQAKKDVEKPDLYKLVQGEGKRPPLLLISISGAGQLVALDVEDPSSPTILDSFTQEGEPKEIYHLGDAFFTISTSDNETILTSYLWSNEKKGLTKGDTMRLKGALMESRRRGEVIYIVVSQGSEPIIPLSEVRGATPTREVRSYATLFAVAIGEDGHLSLLKSREIDGYPEVVSICEDYLTLVTRDSSNGSTQLDVTALGGTDDPLEGPFLISISGIIPSDRHINCFLDKEGGDSYLVFVEGPDWSSQGKGSTIHIYKKERGSLGRLSLSPLSKIDGIAPGESLFGTVISDQKAFIVTYERKDPLWVIDLSDPSNPTIEGELTLPGWSEKLFFHDQRLFSVGFLDSTEGSQSSPIRLVSLGLFDVSDPASPRLTSRITPFLGTYDYSWSEATSDERALFLDWERGLVALPLETYSANSTHWIGAYEIRGDSIKAYSPSPIPFGAKRVLWLDEQHLLAFSDRILMALGARFPDLDQGAEVALVPATDWIEWLGKRENVLGLSIDEEIYHGLILDKECIFLGDGVEGCIKKEFSLPHGLSGAEASKDGKDAYLLYDISGPRIAFLKFDSLNNPLIDGPYRIEVSGDERNSLSGPPAYSKGMVLFPFDTYDYKRDEYSTGVYVLFEDELGGKEVVSGRVLSVPGTMAGPTSTGTLVTVEGAWGEASNSYSTRVNLLEVKRDQAILMDTKTLDGCSMRSAYVDGERAFIVCGGPRYPVPLVDAQAVEANASNASTEKRAPTVVSQPGQNGSRLVVLDASDHLKKVGEYPLEGPYEDLVRIDSQTGLLFTISYGGGIYLEDARTLMPWYGNKCRVYRLDQGGGGLEKLMEFSGQCQADPHRVLLTDEAVALAKGLKGVEIIGP